MKVAVTGASGFVGNAVVDRLLKDGLEVRRISRCGTEGVGVAVGNIDSDTFWQRALEDIDVVVHSAARVHVTQEDRTDSLAAFRSVNVDGTRRLAEDAARMGVRRLVYLSSVKVNGEVTEEGLAFRSSDAPRPLDAYGQSKLEAEMALNEVAARTQLEVVVIRPPLVYGPGVKANFARLMQWVRKGIPLPLGAINNRRSLVALPNLVDLVTHCLDDPKAAGQTFMVSDDEDVSTPELIRMMAAAMHVRPRLVPVPVGMLSLGSRLTGWHLEIERLTGSLQVDIRHTCETLDWRPPVSLKEGIRQALTCY